MVAGVRSGFRYVLDAFCTISAGKVPVTFFRKGVNPILLRVSYDRLGQTLVAEAPALDVDAQPQDAGEGRVALGQPGAVEVHHQGVGRGG